MSASLSLDVRRLRRLVPCVLVLLLGACEGDRGRPGPAGPPGPSVTNLATELTVTVDSVTIASPPVVEFTVVNQDGTRFVGLSTSDVRFTLAKLVPGTNGNPSAWQSYVNRKRAPPPASGSTVDAIQGTTDSGGTLEDHGNGTYTYTFGTDVTNVTSPLAVSYEPSLTHRLGLQISGGGLPTANAAFTWRPSDGAISGILQRDIVKTASCNECHGKLTLHSGGRIETQYCVTCHNPGTHDLSEKTVDFTVMIHKIHRGANLPSVQAGGEYAIWSSTKHDYSDVVYPQDIRNCTKCHDAADASTPQGGHWMTQPSVEACGSCHDDVNFTTGAGHSPTNFPATNAECAICHRDNSFPGSVASSHVIPARVAGARFQYNILSVANSAPGQFPSVTFSVTDPTEGDAPYDIKTHPAWTSGANLTVDFGWDNADHHNTGSGVTATPGQPHNRNALTTSVANGDGTFTVTATVAIPMAVTGSGVATLRGRPGSSADGSFVGPVPVKGAVHYFPITDSEAAPRRQVVDIAKCNQCHDQLSLHGSSRTDEPQLCVVCHNANATDINRRPADPLTTADGKKEEAIDFKTLIHGIHAAGFRENGLVVWGFGPDEHDFGKVRFPGILNNCSACHVAQTFAVPLKDGVLATTVDSGASRADPADDTNITPTAAVCSSCHDSGLAQLHMEQNGALFDMSGDPGTYQETCAVCHGPGRLADVAKVHGLAP
jgi:OmcA/MtrC family decaheme c-type cytochrome